jgi:hypothetical protein
MALDRPASHPSAPWRELLADEEAINRMAQRLADAYSMEVGGYLWDRWVKPLVW